jgi:DNA-nicking Smr family endonuclease
MAKLMAKLGKPKDGAKGAARERLDGDALFEAAMHGAVPLKRRPAKPPKAPHKATPRSQPGRTAARAIASALPKSHTPRPNPEVKPSETIPRQHFNGGLDKRNAERLRRGQMTIEARLDLHGHTQANAHGAVHAFIAASHAAGRRCVLIITGKGGPRDDFDSGFMPDRDSGVLRRNLPRWLGEAPVRAKVLRLESARPQHGGDGAYYVLLKRKR